MKLYCKKCKITYKAKNINGYGICPKCKTKTTFTPQFPIVKPPKVSRNDLCSCGSGLKYKNCCRISVAATEVITEKTITPTEEIITEVATTATAAEEV